MRNVTDDQEFPEERIRSPPLRYGVYMLSYIVVLQLSTNRYGATTQNHISNERAFYLTTNPVQQRTNEEISA